MIPKIELIRAMWTFLNIWTNKVVHREISRDVYRKSKVQLEHISTRMNIQIIRLIYPTKIHSILNLIWISKTVIKGTNLQKIMKMKMTSFSVQKTTSSCLKSSCKPLCSIKKIIPSSITWSIIIRKTIIISFCKNAWMFGKFMWSNR
jgi:hypothetical protein